MGIIKVDKELKDILPGFLENRKKDIIDLQQALDKKDYATIEKIGHRVSGSSGGYGFIELGAVAKKIEMNCKEKKYADIEDLINEFERIMNEVEINFV